MVSGDGYAFAYSFRRAFCEARALTVSTLMGVLTHDHFEYDPTVGQVVLKQMWQRESEGIKKVNALIAGGFRQRPRYGEKCHRLNLKKTL